MTNSMTGYASGNGSWDAWQWQWDLRSVNGRGLDLRLRLPDWIDGLEPALRDMLRKALSRGSINLSLRLKRNDTEEPGQIGGKRLGELLGQVAEVERRAEAEHGLTLGATRATDVLALLRQGAGNNDLGDEDIQALRKAIIADFAELLKRFTASRASEGAALHSIIAAQIEQIEALVSDATAAAQDRAESAAQMLQDNLARILSTTDSVDADRVAQELAIIAVKSDVTEEIDRLVAHVAAARDLLVAKGPVGRKLDFLTQEFNREANTLCSKAQSKALTGIGLDLKTVIDQMREQVQNVE